jgi:arsenate reductase
MRIVVYQKPTCTTCRQVYSALKESGADFEAVDYYTDPISKRKLKELLRKLGMTPRELLRTKDPIYKTLRIGDRDLSDAELLDLMVANPDLVQRPIVERGDSAILARPADRIRPFLSTLQR